MSAGAGTPGRPAPAAWVVGPWPAGRPPSSARPVGPCTSTVGGRPGARPRVAFAGRRGPRPAPAQPPAAAVAAVGSRFAGPRTG
eukprot:2468286-Alexandrium_andersonii.AAC.1